MAAFTLISDCVAELLAGEAAGDICYEEYTELQRLLGDAQVTDRDQMMRVAGLVQLVLLRRDRPAQVALPDPLREKLVRQAHAWQSGRRTSSKAVIADLETARQRPEKKRQVAVPGPATAQRNSSRSALGWYLAAALAVAFVVFRPQPDPDVAPVAASLQARRDALVSRAPDLLQVPWSASAQPGYEQARGDVVWSSARQEGYLRVSGLPVNDAGRDQYQLWVVDASRDIHSVDGGVFDITREGELIIAIDTSLPVSQPSAFAVTLEKPGGVVVSDGPMLLVAAVGG